MDGGEPHPLAPQNAVEALQETFGTLLAHGHDLDTLLYRYNREQIAAMALCIIRHKSTTARMMAFSLGGKPALERTPGAPQTATNASPEDKEAGQNKALAQLGQLQGMVGRMVGKGGGLDEAAKAQDRLRAQVSKTETPTED